MQNKKIILIPIFLIFLMLSVSAVNMTVSITPTENSVACSDRDTNYVLTVGGLGGSKIVRIDLLVGAGDVRSDINNTQKLFGIKTTTGTEVTPDGNFATDGTGALVVQLDPDPNGDKNLTTGTTYDLNVYVGAYGADSCSSVEAGVDNNCFDGNYVSTRIYLRPPATYSGYTIAGDSGSTSWCTISDYSTISNFKLTKTGGEQSYIQFTSDVNLDYGFNLNTEIPTWNERELKLYTTNLLAETATLHFLNARIALKKLNIYKNDVLCYAGADSEAGISDNTCTSVDYDGTNGIQFTVSGFSAYRMDEESRNTGLPLATLPDGRLCVMMQDGSCMPLDDYERQQQQSQSVVGSGVDLSWVGQNWQWVVLFLLVVAFIWLTKKKKMW